MKNFFKKIKLNASFIVPWLILGLAVVIFGSGLTYAYFDFVLNSQQESSLRITGTDFEVSLYGSTIGVSNVTPIYDEYYETQALEYDFQVKNTSRRIEACYSLYFNVTDISEGLISSDFKWKLVNVDTLETSDGTFAGASDPEILIQSNNDILAHHTDNYKLYIWLSYSGSDQNDMSAASFSSNLKLTAFSGQCPVDYRQNGKLNNIRYVRDCTNGNTVNIGNHWVELQAIYNETNVAYGKTVIGTSPEYSASYPYSRITDGDTTSANWGGSSLYGLQCVTVDLSQKYDLDEIKVWHYYADGRTYYSNTTYVSRDNVTWIPVIANTAAESSQGKSVSVDDSNATVTPIFMITNMVTNGSFENTGWSGGAYNTTYKKYGTYSYALTGTTGTAEVVAPTSAVLPTALDNTHIYYTRVEGYQATKAGNAVQIYWPIAEPMFGTLTLGNASSWNLYSFRATKSTFTNGTYQLRVDYDNANIAGVMYFDGITLIDLTATFGSGKEPSKAWCDANLNYFDGSQNMYLPLN